jgi:hypothetical protein
VRQDCGAVRHVRGHGAGQRFVTIYENEFADWSFGDGAGQYLERDQDG